MKKRRKLVKPDDYFKLGPFEAARFGKFAFFRMNMSEEQFEKMQDMHAKRFPEVCQEIDEKVTNIANMVKGLPPDELLKRAYWEMAAHHVNIKSEIQIDKEASISLRMVDYIQSIIASVEPAESIKEEVTEEDWQQLRSLVRDLFSQLNLEYQICRTASAYRSDPHYDKDFDEYYVKAQLYWCNVRGQRYIVHEAPFFRSLLSPHNDVLIELFGVSSEELVDAIQKIQDSLTFGIDNLMKELKHFQKVTTEELEKKIKVMESVSPDDLPVMMSEVIEEKGWEAWRDNVLGRFHGLDLFDLEKLTNLPSVLLDELSWTPGQDSEFFAEGDYKGWPLRIWPIFKRPFIKLGNGYYCFELQSFFDNFYRALQRLIVRMKPQYNFQWNQKQKEVSEQIPCELFEKLLPSAQIHQSVYYRWYTSQAGHKQWCEVDSLVIFEDHLFIVEVKAGAFTYTPPATDFPAYIESLKNLIFKPAEQGRRFLEYLQSDNEVVLFDRNHNQIGNISKNDFEHITICTITLDPFTELAARVEHLKNIGIDVGEHPVWSVSVSDLMVYSDIFDNPLSFLHYVEQRVRAFKEKIVDVEDELDHLGLYLKHNVYSKYAQELDADGRIRWHGYRSAIDGYFSNKLSDPGSASPLKQYMPERLRQIIDLLALGNKPGRRKVSSALLDCSGEWRDIITSHIDDVLKEQSVTRRAKPFSTYGGIKFTLFCWHKGIMERDEKLCLDHTRAAMLVTGDMERLLLELFFDEGGSLVDIYYQFLRIEEIPNQDLPQLRAKADALRSRRLSIAKEAHGKIGRNDPCPCGSGKKYKKCCLLL